MEGKGERVRLEMVEACGGGEGGRGGKNPFYLNGTFRGATAAVSTLYILTT